MTVAGGSLLEQRRRRTKLIQSRLQVVHDLLGQHVGFQLLEAYLIRFF